jgi:hypothetical protein
LCVILNSPKLAKTIKLLTMKRLFTTFFILFSFTIITAQPWSATDSVISPSTNSTVRDWARGFDFTPNSNITLTHIGKRVPATAGTFIWKIWVTGTQQLVHQQVSTFDTVGVYHYEPISAPVTLNAGTQYTLTLYGDSSGYYFGASSQINSNLTFGTMRYCNNCYAGQPFPTQTFGNYHYGTPDFLFVICTGSTSSNISPTACDSYLSPAGKTYTTTNTYVDTIRNSVGCDSIITINLTVNNSSTDSIAPSVCGSSYIAPSGNYTWTSSGVYTDTLQNAIGCDSIITVNLTLNPYPTVNIDTLSTDTICVQQTTFTLPIATPSGGTYAGPGVTGNNFNASTAGVGSHMITYTYTDTATNCTNSDTITIAVAACVGISENALANIEIFPNPVNEVLNIDFGDEQLSNLSISLKAIDGKQVFELKNVKEGKIVIDMSDYSKGIYMLYISDGVNSYNKKIVKR